MSRCFPFPPPGYVLNGVRDEALIESIKRAEEKAKKEQRRKERKREKKEKKDKKRKEREGGEGESEKHSHKRRRKEEVAKDGKTNQKVESENCCLEKSSLTVERDLLQSTSQNSCDSTVNSIEQLPKQQKEKKQPHNNNNNDSESIIRIRLPIRRQNVPEVMLTTNKDHQKPCPSREIKLDTVKIVTREQQQQQHPCSTSKPHEEKRKDHIVTMKLGKEKKLSSTSQPSSGLCRFCPPSLAVEFLNVVENWVPNTIERRVEELTNSGDDECWWFLKKPSSHKFDETERCKQLYRNNESKQVISSSMAWPCARLLPEADVHALPYTVPF